MSPAALHPDIAALLDMVKAGVESGARKPLPLLTPQAAREDFEESSPLLDVEADPLLYERRLSLPTRDGSEIETRLYAPSAPDPHVSLPVTLAMHSGGFVVGSLDSHEWLCRRLAAATDAAVLSIGYRLAPEHKFPTAFEDACDALAWIGREGVAAGLDRERVAFFGDSAGGTLAAALAIAARDDAGLPTPVLQVLAYPGLSSHQDTESFDRYGRGYLLEAETVRWFFEQYLRDQHDREDWRFAPLAALDLSGVAPALIVLPEFDPLVDEGNAYADRLRAAGVSVRCQIYRGMIHEFLRMGNVVNDALEAQTEIASALARAFAGKSMIGEPSD